MTQRTSGPVPDNTTPPYIPPHQVEVAQEDKEMDNEFAAFGLSQKYPEVVKYLEERKEFWRKFRPGGVPIADITPKNYHEYIVAEMTAANIITELDAFINLIEIQKDATKRRNQ